MAYLPLEPCTSILETRNQTRKLRSVAVASLNIQVHGCCYGTYLGTSRTQLVELQPAKVDANAASTRLLAVLAFALSDITAKLLLP